MASGEIVAVDISAEDYLAQYAVSFHEWVRGVVIKMSPISGQHDLLTAYLRHLLDAYFALRSIGQVRAAPFVMHLKTTGSMREPDLQIILNSNPGSLTATAMVGPADICIEIVSPESVARDYGNKFEEYEKAGVHEYWIIDPVRQRCELNRLQEGVYIPVAPDFIIHLCFQS